MSSAPLRSILAEFGIKFDHGEVHKAEHGVTGLIETLKRVSHIAAEAFIVREVYEFGERIVEAGVALEHLSVKTGVATGELQALEYAAKLSGVGAEELDTALGKLGKTLALAKGAKIAGIDTKDIKGTRSAADFLPDVADKFLTLTNTSDRAALAIKLFGRAGVQLVPLLAKGSAGIRELTEEAKELGGGLSEEAIAGAVKLEESTKKLDFAFTGLKGTIAESVFPELAKLAEGAAHLVKDFRDWTKSTKLIEAATIGFTARGVLALLHHLGGLTGAFKLLSGAVLRTILPLIVLEDFIVFMAGGRSEIGKLVDVLFGKGSQEKLRDFINDAVGKVEEFFKQLRAGGENFKVLKGYWEDLKAVLIEHSGQIAAVAGLYVAWKIAVTSLTVAQTAYTVALGIAKAAQIAFRVATVAAAAVQAAYTAAVGIATGALALFSGGEAAATAGAFLLDASLAPILVTLGLMSVAIGSVIAAWVQLNKLKSETGGLGFTGIIKEMAQQGTLNPFKAVDEFQNRKAREEAGLNPERGTDISASTGLPRYATDPLVDRSVSAQVSQNTSNVTNKITVKNEPKINVNVAAGTPESEARGVGRAAAQGAKFDLGATKAALVPTAG